MILKDEQGNEYEFEKLKSADNGSPIGSLVPVDSWPKRIWRNLDKELEKIYWEDFNEYVPAPIIGDLENVGAITIAKIKSVILEALKAEWPKRKKSVENMGNEMGGSFIGDDYNELYRAEDFGYNQALADCLSVCNKLLGDSNE